MGEGLLASLRRQRFAVLLTALSLLFVLAPLLRIVLGPRDEATARGWLTLGFLAALLAAAYAVSRSRRTLLVGGALALIVAVLQGADAMFDHPGLLALHHSIAIAFLAHVCFQVLRHLFTVKRVDTDLVCAALCLYLLAGLAWSLVFSLVELAEPGSFSASFATAAEPFVLSVSGGGSADAFYFSFVTLTTLGFGDIVPTTQSARMLVVAEALMGQLYLAVLVARVVGLHVAGAASPPETPS